MGVNVYFPALSSNKFTEGPPGYFTFPNSLVENPIGSGLYEIPGYLIPEGGDLYSIPLPLVGSSERGTSNIKTFSVQEDATPIDPSSSAGGVGQITVGLDDFEDAPRLIGEIVLTDGSRGKTSGTVRSINVNDGALNVVADSVLGQFNTERTAKPFVGTLKNAIQYYCDLVGIQNDVFVDTTVASRNVVYPGWVGNAWVQMKQLLAVESVEMALVFDRVYVRPLRQLTANQNKLMSSSWTLDNNNAAKSVEVAYYNHTTGSHLEVYPVVGEETPAPLTVNAGETITVLQQLNASLWSVNQPTCVSFVYNRPYPNTVGVYSVVGSDNLPVTPSQWAAQGGRVTVSLTEDPSVIRIRVTGASMEKYAPYRIAMSSGSGNDYNSLHITGSGVVLDREVVTLTTGATTATTSTEVGVTVENPYIRTRAQAYSLGLRTAKAYAGINYGIAGSALDLNRKGEGTDLVQATIADFNLATPPGTLISDFNTLWTGEDISDFNDYWNDQISTLWANQLFGNAPGARVLNGDANFRITSATTSEASVQYTATLDTLIEDFSGRWSPEGTVAVRTNFNSNPLPASLTGYTRGGTVASTVTYQATDGPAATGGKWIKNTVTGTTGTDNQISISQVVTSSPLRSLSAWVWSSKNLTVWMRAWTYDGAGTYLGASNDMSTPQFVIPANTWTLVSYPLTQPPLPYQRYTAFIRLAGGQTVSAGDVYGIALFTPSDQVGGPFTGSSIDTHVAGVTTDYAWVGVTDASRSTETITTNDYRISDFNAQFAGMTMKDYSVVPLRKEF